MKRYLYLIVAVLFYGCTNQTEKQDVNSSIIALADSYFERTIEFHPEYAYFADIPLDNHAGISSNELHDVKLWENFEDSLYTQLEEINISELTTRKAKITYWFLKEDLESSIAMRVCKRNLWNVDPESGWHSILFMIAQVQPVGTDEYRQQAIARWEKIPDIFETEIRNLKIGLSQGYSMPTDIVNLVLNQLHSILNYEIDESPFMLPAIADGDEEFYSQWKKLISQKILPAVKNYHSFLENEYVSNARNNVSILALPNGEQCYQAYIRKYTTTNKTGNEIFEEGQKNVSKNKVDIETIGKELYNTENFDEIISRINIDTSNYFSSAEEIIATTERLMNKARNESKNWFIKLPAKEVTIKPYDPHEVGSGAYETSAGDKPPYFRVNLTHPEKQQKGKTEVLVFHETYPGHHMQIGLEKEIGDLHPIVKLISFTSYVEGWARYCEQFAEEINLYESKSALITRRAWPSRGMVADPGIHIKGWSKEQALEYMMESGFSEEVALNLYHRSITMPAQLTSYDVGGEEIKALRVVAEQKLGDTFDVKEFHEKVLENGAIPLNALSIIIKQWIEEKMNISAKN